MDKLYQGSWRRKGQPIPVFLPGACHGQRSLVGCSPWGPKELDMTKQAYVKAVWNSRGGWAWAKNIDEFCFK